MYPLILRPAGVLCLLAALPALPAWGPLAAAEAPAYSIKTVADQEPPKELAGPIRKLLDRRCVRLSNARGDLLVELWLRKEVPVNATEAQIKNGLTYREVASSTVLGAMRVVKAAFDYKKQKVPAGVYTLRLGIQPADGDHMGTAPYNEFLLACPAADDTKPDLLMVKPLRELSAKVTDSHPAVFLLFPGGKDAGTQPKLLPREGGHHVLFVLLPARAGDKKATLPLGLNLIGSSASA